MHFAFPASPRLATAFRMLIIIPGCAAAAQLTSNFRGALEDTLNFKIKYL
jgi:hypothetical protein